MSIAMAEPAAPLDNVVRFEPRGAHAELMRCRDTEVAAVGMAGSGKTIAACWKLHLAAMLVPGLRGLMLRATHISLTSTTLVTFQRQVANQALADGTVKWFGGSAKDPAAFRYSNGSTILVAGGDRPEKFLSAELDRILADEAIELTLDLHETLISRLRGSAPTYRQIMLLTNPGAPSHWIKQRSDEGALRVITSTHLDNPHYTNPDGTTTDAGREYMQKLDAMTGLRRTRLRDGQWQAAEGVIFDGWDEETHLIDRFAIPDSWTRWMSIDWGFTNPAVVQFWAEDGDGRLYLYREIVRTKTLVETLAKDILAMVTDERGRWTEPQPTAIIADHDGEDRATFEKHFGMRTVAAHKAVTSGIQAFQSRLEDAGDGRPRLFAFKDALVERDANLSDAKKPIGLAEEALSYVWAVKPGAAGGLKEQPLKENDHSCDAARYLVAHRDIKGEPSIRWLGGRR